jgi:hypothetical protein
LRWRVDAVWRSSSCSAAGPDARPAAQVRCNNPVGAGVNDTDGTADAFALDCMRTFIG